MAHERLSIVDPESGGQPLFSPDRQLILAVNGEIYNHRELRERYAGKYDFKTGSDCEVILALYHDKGTDLFEDLNGIFALVVHENECREVLYGDLPYCLHAQLRILYTLDALDRTLRENGCSSTHQ